MEASEASTLRLSHQELRWARNLKAATIEAAAKGDHLKEISDFEYAHFALFTKGNVKEALERIELVQHFREEYRVEDSANEGMEILLRLTKEQQPWFMVSVDHPVALGHFVYVYDYARLNPGIVKYPEDWRIFLGGMYYLFQMAQCNFTMCREGAVHIAECKGMGLANFNADFIRQFWCHLGSFYPLINKEASWLHTPLEGNLQHAFYKRLMGPIANIIQVGCQFEGYDGRIDEMFKTPSEEAAEERLLSKYQHFLGIRYHNQANFRLTSPDPPAGLDTPLGPAGNEEETASNG